MKFFLFRIFFIVGVINCGNISQASPTAPLQLEKSTRSHGNELNSELTNQISSSRIATPLPDNIVPRAYSIKVRPILDPGNGTNVQWTAPGQVNITIEFMESGNKQISFHRDAGLTIRSVKLSAGSISNQTFDPETMIHTLNLASSLPYGKLNISIDFTANISATTKGLYRAEYKDENGTSYRLAATQFEYSNARQAFPCFDEPRWKTPFTISLGYKNDTYNTLSNSIKIITAQPDPSTSLKGWVWDHYNVTKPMPTYLVAMLVSNFDYLEAPEPVFGNRSVRIYGEPRYIAPGGNKAAGGAHFAANASAHILAFLESKYVHPYEMPKMDSVAIPNPFFGPGAMENWGLNIYKENYLLFWEGEQSWADKEKITSIFSHELAHQWFGNLVTCKTWADLWLNEGFAIYVQNFGVDQLHPEFEELHSRLVTDLQSALSGDVTDSVPIHTEGAPNVIVYDKGAAIIRMMEGFLGPDTLTKGACKAYKVAEQDDLYQHLTEQAILDEKLPPSKTVKTIMDTWTLQAGFPLIHVSKFDGSRLIISQKRFQPIAGPPSNELYEVPIATATKDSDHFSNHTPTVWMSQAEISITLLHNTSEWILINPDAMGYYRVLYDEDLLELILNELYSNRNTLSSLSRSQLIDDYFTFYEQGHIRVEQALDVTTTLSTKEGIEGDFVVWFTLFNHLSKALTMFQSYNGGPNHSLKNYLLPKITEALFEIGWMQAPKDEGALVLYKSRLLDWACALESSWCFRFAQDLMTHWIENPDENYFLVDTQAVMYCAAVANEGEPVFNFLLNQFEAAPVGTFKSHRAKLLNALSCAKDSYIIEQLLYMAIDNTTVIGSNPADSLNVFQRVAGNPIGRQILLNFITSSFDQVLVALGGLPGVISVLDTVSSYYTRPNELSDFEGFIDYHQVLQGALDGALQRVEENINWMNANYDAMDAWFASHS